MRLGRRTRQLPAELLEIVAATLAPWSHLPAVRREQVEAAAARLLRRADVEAAKGFQVTDEIVGTVLGHAGLLAAGRHDRTFRDVRAVVVHPRTIVLTGERPGPTTATVTTAPEAVAGHTTEHGPVFIDWNALRREARTPHEGRNVAFHEFAHKLDAENGPIDGVPAVGRRAEAHWREVCEREYEAVRRGRGTRLLDPYAGHGHGEFFAVTTEVFFTRPVALAIDRPHLYGAFRDYYGQDPANEWTISG